MLIKNVLVFIGMLMSWPTLVFVQAAPERAACELVGSVQGTIIFEETRDDLLIEGTLVGVPLGKHGIHVHESGKTGNNCLDAGGHYNPSSVHHGAPTDMERHVGDYGSFDSTGDRYALSFTDNVSRLSGPNSILGRSLVIHAGEDDLGRGDNAASRINGNSGPRIACCVIVSV